MQGVRAFTAADTNPMDPLVVGTLLAAFIWYMTRESSLYQAERRATPTIEDFTDTCTDPNTASNNHRWAARTKRQHHHPTGPKPPTPGEWNDYVRGGLIDLLIFLHQNARKNNTARPVDPKNYRPYNISHDPATASDGTETPTA